MIALTNGVFFTGDNLINNKSLLVKNESIVGFVNRINIPHGTEIIDLNGKNVAPGFFDLQVNGGGGKFFNPKELSKHVSYVSNLLSHYGVTRWMPTFLSLSKKGLTELQFSISEIVNNNGVLGVHLEGPWIDKEKTGIHCKKSIRFWNCDDFDFVNQCASYSMVCLTLSCLKIKPEELFKLSNIKGVKVLLGHTSASYIEAKNFFSSGGAGVTHIFNAMIQPTSREPGVVLAAMDNNNIYASVIADLIHVAPATLRLLKRAFDKGMIYLVSDAMPVFGSNENEFFIGKNKCTIDNGRITDQNGNLAGSSITISDSIRNCIQSVGIPMDEALRMSTLYPAKFLGIDNEYGLLKTGYKADFVVFDNQINIIKTYRDGKLIFEYTPDL